MLLITISWGLRMFYSEVGYLRNVVGLGLFNCLSWVIQEALQRKWLFIIYKPMYAQAASVCL